MCIVVVPEYDRRKYGSPNVEMLVNELLAYHCMPTLLHAKPSTLVSLDIRRMTEVDEFLVLFYDIVKKFDCRLYLLPQAGMRVNFLLYSETLLCQCLACDDQKQFLTGFGYGFREDIPGSILRQLSRRYANYRNNHGVFPHEIGIVLGYPVGDVEGFIRNRGRNYLLCGAWKVYQEADAARRIFSEYQNMKLRALKQINTGNSIIDLLRNRDLPE